MSEQIPLQQDQETNPEPEIQAGELNPTDIAKIAIAALNKAESDHKDIKDLSESLEKRKKEIARTENITYLGFTILLLMLGLGLIDTWRNKGASIETLVGQINQQNIELQNSNNEIKNLNEKFQVLLTNIARLETPTSTPAH